MKQTVIYIAGAPCSGKTVFSTKLYLEFLERGESSVELIQEEAGRLIRNGRSVTKATIAGHDLQYWAETKSKAEFLIVESPTWVREQYLKRGSNNYELELHPQYVRITRPADYNFFLTLPDTLDMKDTSAAHRDSFLNPYSIEKQLEELAPKNSTVIPFDYEVRAKAIRQLVDDVLMRRDLV